MSFSLRYAAASDTGRMRKNNQDSGIASPVLLAVADGMGGAAAGDLASAVAVTELATVGERLEGADMLERLSGLLEQANQKLADLVASDFRLDGMGTTVCGAMFSGAQLGLAHIGDSRGYLLRDGQLRALTRDHSWVQSLVDEGRITEAQAAVHPNRSLLLKVLNGHPGIEPDFELIDVRLGDKVMFCSDGLCGMIDDSLIAELLGGDDLEAAVDELVDAANAAGGLDNITVVAAEVVAQDDELDQATQIVLGAAVEREIPPITHQSRDNGFPEAAGPDDEESRRYAPLLRRHPWASTTIIALLVLGLVGGGLASVFAYANSRFFVGTAEGKVAIYQGVPGSLLGRPLQSVREVTRTRVSDLPPFYQDQVSATLSVPDMTAARATARQLAAVADRCVEIRAKRVSPPASPGASPPASPGASPPASPGASPPTSPGVDPDFEGC